MNPADYQYQSEFARRYISVGRAEGRAEGKAELLIRQATLKFGPLPQEIERQVRMRAAEELDRMAERLLGAASVEEMLGAS
jgi:Domain of unknown function (DUF4351)